MKLPLGARNRLAELILEAFEVAEARRTLEDLARFCRSEDGDLDADAAARLAKLAWFEPTGAGRVRIRGSYRAHLETLCRRVAAALRIFRIGQVLPSADTLSGLLARAALLANAGLYFEVHELLEPAWMRAEGAERVALQGLIQIAVAFHHAATGNREGALSLLTEGRAKIAAAGPALPLDTAAWQRALDMVLAAWQQDGPVPSVPTWPSPEGPGDQRSGEDVGGAQRTRAEGRR